VEVTIQDLGSINELVAAIATIITLAYLARQIRASARATALESIRVEAASGEAALLAVAENGELADIFERGLADQGSLDPPETTRFTMIISVIVSSSEVAFMQQRVGIGTGYVDEVGANGVSFLRAPGGRQWWRKNRHQFRSDYADWLEQQLGLKE